MEGGATEKKSNSIYQLGVEPPSNTTKHGSYSIGTLHTCMQPVEPLLSLTTKMPYLCDNVELMEFIMNRFYIVFYGAQ